MNIKMAQMKLPEYWIPQDLKNVLLKDEHPIGIMTDKTAKFSMVLETLKSIDRLELEECHYLQFLKLALYLEEFQQCKEFRKYNMYGKKIERKESSTLKEFKIHIKDFEKDHPLHKSTSLIEVINSKDPTKKKFVLKVKDIGDDYVTATAYPEFVASYDPRNTYNIRFRFNSYPFRCSHYALYCLNMHKVTSYLFPSRDKNPIADLGQIELNERKWFNTAISKNPEQKKAVLNILSKSSFPAPYILYGPPGTGKTATLVEAVCQIVEKSRERLFVNENVLICAPSNAAADVIAKRLLKYIPAARIDRIYGRSRDSTLIDAELRTCSNCSKSGRILKVNSKVLSTKTIVISTLSTCTRISLLNLSTTYSYVFIDEAGQSTEPESLIPFNIINRHGASRCQLVISGDPKQLGPGIRSRYALPILGQSMLERLMKLDPYKKCNNNEYDARYITKLLRNYRSHPAIIRVSNELYYENELVACSTDEPFENEEFQTQFPIIFHSVDGNEKKENNSTSCYNEAESEKVMDYVHLLIGEKLGEKRIAAEDMGIVTPFALQSKKLQKRLKEEGLEDVAVGTVEVFQGQEKEVIIMSTVRSRTFLHDEREHIGFLSNPRRFNVALTRAKAVLVVVGNPVVLQHDPNWRCFVQFCRDNRACRGDQTQLDRAADQLLQLTREPEPALDTKPSLQLFDANVALVSLNDGIIRDKKNKHLFNGRYYNERQCAIL